MNEPLKYNGKKDPLGCHTKDEMHGVEVSNFNHLKEVMNNTKHTPIKGVMIFGTGGEYDRNKELEDIFYHPRHYNLIPFNDDKPCGLFKPEFGSIDENGNVIKYNQ